VRLLKGSFLLGDLPISSLESIAAVEENEKGLIGEKQNRKIAIVYREARGGARQSSMTLDADDDKADEIVGQLATFRRLEVSDGYFTPRILSTGQPPAAATYGFRRACFSAPRSWLQARRCCGWSTRWKGYFLGAAGGSRR